MTKSLSFKICYDKKTSNITTALKSKMIRIELFNLQTRFVKFKDQKKAKNVLNS